VTAVVVSLGALGIVKLVVNKCLVRACSLSPRLRHISVLFDLYERVESPVDTELAQALAGCPHQQATKLQELHLDTFQDRFYSVLEGY